MGMALSWISIALAGFVGAAKPERSNAELQYTVRFVETDGLSWRKTYFNALTPVARQGAATIWTAPRSAALRLCEEVAAGAHGRVLRAPRITMKSGHPAHVSSRSNRRLITQVSWNGEDQPGPGKPEIFRTGPVATMIGRKLDQGVLLQLVCEDTQVSAVHRVLLGKAQDQCAAGEKCEAKDQACRKAAGSTMLEELAAELAPGEREQCAVDGPPSDQEKSNDCDHCEKGAGTAAVAVDVPEINHQEVAGEWLVPNDGVLLVSFGPNTTTGDEGKAVVRERLAIIEVKADADGAVPMEFAAAPAASSDLSSPPIVVPPSPPEALEVPNVPEPAPAPSLPSRTIPRGVHPDGRPASLPPLPADEAVPPPSTLKGKPVPTPQTKQLKPVKPAGAAQPSPTIDPDAKPTSFSPPGRPMPLPMRGLQFLVPLRPISLRLPFNQRLELEVYGRLVPDPARGARSDKDD